MKAKNLQTNKIERKKINLLKLETIHLSTPVYFYKKKTNTKLIQKNCESTTQTFEI